MRKLLTSLSLAAISLLTACATPTFTQSSAVKETNIRTKEEVGTFAAPAPRGVVREVSESQVSFVKKAPVAKRGDVNLKVAAAPFGPVLADLGKRYGYSVSFADQVDTSRKVTMEFVDANSEDAIRTAAFLAGYVAVVDKDRKSILVAETATYTFRLPAGVFSALQADYDVGGDPSSSGNSGAKGGAQGSSLKAKFAVTGKENQPGAGLMRLVTDLVAPAGRAVFSDGGYVSVTGGAQALRRVTDLLRKVSVEAMTQVDIEASIIEVSLGSDFQAGIDWQQVVNKAATGGVNWSFATNAADILNPNLSISRTSASSTSLIQALQTFTEVRVVSQPRLFSMNNSPANFAEVTQLPYLGSLEQTSSGTSSSPTVSGNLSFAVDGVTFSVVPVVIDENNVQISLLPVLSTVGNRNTFALGANQLTAYTQNNKQSFMRVMAEPGKTLILGGIRTGSEKNSSSLATATSNSRVAKEVVILLRATPHIPRSYNPLVAESL